MLAMQRIFTRFCASISLSILFLAAPLLANALTASGPIVINGQNGTVISGLHITSTSGDCVKISNSTNIIIQNSEIGPCGGHGVHISGGSNNNVYDNYIHVENRASGCCDTHEGVRVDSGSGFDAIQGNVIAYNETNVRVDSSAHDITVNGNFLLNPMGPYPRGQNFQSDTAANMTVTNNYALSSTDTSKYLYPAKQEDSINFYKTNGSLAQGNYITGAQSASGCGLITDDGSQNNQYLNNILSNTGQCGIGIATGVNQVVSNNKVLNLNPFAGAGNTAIYVWNQYASACSNVTVSNNIADGLKPDLTTHSGYWNGGNCGTVTESGNTWNLAAYNLLNPMSTTNPPPPIPVQPKNCVAVSPYTTNTSMAPCSSGGGTPPPPASDTTAPSVPANLSGTAISSSQINLTWTASIDNIGVAGYKVFRNGVQAGTPTGAAYSDTGLTASTAYAYTVSAYDAAGNASAQSASVSVTTQTNPVSTSGLAGYWKFDEGSGTVAADSSGNGNNGTLVNGPTWTTGKVGNALSFNGVSAAVTIPASTQYDTSTFTMSFWIKPLSLNSGGQWNNIVMGREAYTLKGFRFGLASNGAPRFWTTQSGGSITLASTAAAPLNAFAHVVVTYDGSTARMYVNGVQSGTASGTYVPPSGVDLTIDGGIGGTIPSNSVIDDVRWYNRALSASEIQTLYNNGSVPDTASPSIPAGLSGKAISSSQINLTWTASTDDIGVAGYKVFRDGVQAGIQTGTSYSDTGLTASTVYSYTVAAYDAAGNTSAQSTAVSAITTGSAALGIAIGGRVMTTANLNVRSSPLPGSAKLGSESVGSLGTVVGGPTTAKSHSWWQIKWDDGLNGWSIADYLVAIRSTSSPVVGLAIPSPSVSSQSTASLIQQLLQQIHELTLYVQKLQSQAAAVGAVFGN